MALKTYKTATDGYKMQKASTIKSGVISGDSDAELMLVEPLKRHPEISGLYRAIDPTTGWLGWVPYEEPARPVVTEDPLPPDEKELSDNKDSFTDLMREYQSKKELVDSGIYTEEELGLPALKTKIRAIFDDSFIG